MSIIESLKKLVDGNATREQAAELERFRQQPRREVAGPPPTFQCRVCDHVGPEPAYCPKCLAETMRPSQKQATGPAVVAPPEPEPVAIPIDGTLDLHTIDPSEIGELLPEYLRACQEQGLLEVRVVHGKGTGALRRSVQALLSRSPLVERFAAGDESAGGWGATVVTLKKA